MAVYARLEINDPTVRKIITTVEDPERLDEKTRFDLRSACDIVNTAIGQRQRKRERFPFYCGFLLLVFLLFFPSGNPTKDNYFFTMFIIFKNLFCIIAIVMCMWFVCLGRPIERNGMNAILNAMRIRLGLRPLQFTH